MVICRKPGCARHSEIGGDLVIRKNLCFVIIPSVMLFLISALAGISAISIVMLKDSSIPSILEECYIALDSVLSEDEKNDLKNAGNGNLFRSAGFPDNRWNELITEGLDPVDLDLFSTHFGLALWIRNEWIYPSPNSNIASKFLIAGVTHPDEMSSMIISGYYKYLNDMPYKITIQTKAVVSYVIAALIFTSSLALVVVGKYRKKRYNVEPL